MLQHPECEHGSRIRHVPIPILLWYIERIAGDLENFVDEVPRLGLER